MTLNVLEDMREVRAARARLKELNLAIAAPHLLQRLQRLVGSKALPVGDRLKSWDLLRSYNFIQQNLQKADTVFDHGCFCSEILPILHQAGFENLVGADLNPRVIDMPYSDAISYRTEDFMHSGLANESVNAITSVSVMEHGYDEECLLTEVSRLLKPGGYYLSSFDYWPDKLDTSAVQFFDLSWTIFSRQDLESLLKRAEDFGLRPVGELNFAAAKAPISCAGFAYTFAWLALQKSK
ncbi:MAG: class I SAM-dependent methyltransferase [Congregibacter sp.]